MLTHILSGIWRNLRMRKMLNTLYITSEEAYASLNGENIEVKIGMDEKKAADCNIKLNIQIE